VVAFQLFLQFSHSFELSLEKQFGCSQVIMKGLLLFFDVLADQSILLSEGQMHHIHDTLLSLFQLLSDPCANLSIETVQMSVCICNSAFQPIFYTMQASQS